MAGDPRLAQLQQLQRQGDLHGAAQLLAKLVQERPRDLNLRFQFAASLVGIGAVEPAIPQLEQILKAKPGEPRVSYCLSTAHHRAGDIEKAHRVLDEAMRGRAPDPMLCAGKAELFNVQGRFAEAMDVLEPVVAASAGSVMVLFAYSRACAGAAEDGQEEAAERGIAILEKLLERPDLPPGARMDTLYRLAELQDLSGAHQRAFESAIEAGKLDPRRFDVAAHVAAVDQAISTWTRERIAELSYAEARGDERMVFIVGMPRSGTSLVEQILASHPDVHACGELPHIGRIARGLPSGAGVPGRALSADAISTELVRKAAREYLDAIRKLAPRSALCVTDKNPPNVMHMGLMAAMFPRAKFVVCERHPLDVCVSCFMKPFPALDFTHDLASLGTFAREKVRILEHWKRVVPCAMLEVGYETLVSDQEAGTRQLVEFAGLEWDDACLAFHTNTRYMATASSAQVRRPMYTSSVHRFTRYERHLEPLKTALGDVTYDPSPIRVIGSSEGEA